MIGIFCTAAYDEAIENKISIYRKLNEIDIDVSNYLNGITEIGVVFQCFPKNDPSRQVKQYKTLRRKTKVLELYLVLDYDKIMTGNDEENLQHIKEIFLQGCKEFLMPIKGFDYDGFIEVINSDLTPNP